ncbi:uncharacterized protein LOC107269528 [Cephus cinctus]|uniref:Uncharacterized protein LOC107269528 n=1 Tax=Cephus cinctus TaxID=211228 RepID=A0AAJ7C0Q0_CEPCN|nr:uncharacterized protein LOC107269528 [Cephus cinctus]
MLYADDLQIYLHIKPCDLASALVLVQRDIDSICEWAVSNCLSVNPSKTRCMILGSARYINQIDFDCLPYLSADGTRIPYSTSTRNLGLTIDSALSWNVHTTNVCSQIVRTLYLLKTNRNSLSMELRKLLVSSLIFPIIDYCLIIYGATAASNLNRVQVALNSCVRFIFDAKRDEHISPYYAELDWLTVSSRRLKYLGLLVYQIINMGSPTYLATSVISASSAGVRTVRRANDLIVPIHRTEFYRHSFHVSAALFWNSLPNAVRNSTSQRTFKSRLHQFLLPSIAPGVTH